MLSQSGHRSLLLSLLLCNFIIAFLKTNTVFGDNQDSSDTQSQYNCPNGGEPLIDERTGRPFQCLPGTVSTPLCGAGYACFFSGFNYHCCPSMETDEENASLRESEAAEQGEDTSSSAAADEEIQPRKDDDELAKEECPEGSFSVLDSNGEPLQCDLNGKCPHRRGMFCHGTTTTNTAGNLCCERIETDEEEVVAEEKLPLSAALSKTNTESSPAIEAALPSQDKQNEDKNPKEIKTKIDGDVRVEESREHNGWMPNEEEKISLPTHHREQNGIHSTTAHNKDKFDSSSVEDDPIAPSTAEHHLSKEMTEEKTSSSVREIENNDRSGDNRLDAKKYDNSRPREYKDRKNVQNYLLGQIKEGWPYEDKFYRPANNEDIVVMKKRGHASAIVHFPN